MYFSLYPYTGKKRLIHLSTKDLFCTSVNGAACMRNSQMPMILFRCSWSISNPVGNKNMQYTEDVDYHNTFFKDPAMRRISMVYFVTLWRIRITDTGR